MKLKRIVSSLLAVVMAFGVVSLATVDENGKIFGNTLTAEAVTERQQPKCPTMQSHSAIPIATSLKSFLLQAKTVCTTITTRSFIFTALQTTLSEKFMITTIKADTKTLLSAFMPIPKKASFI